MGESVQPHRVNSLPGVHEITETETLKKKATVLVRLNKTRWKVRHRLGFTTVTGTV